MPYATASQDHATRHRLAPLLTPRSVAVVGASAREGSVGHLTLAQLMRVFSGSIYPVNPNYEELEGQRCYPDLTGLPEAPDLAVLCLPNAALEEAVAAAIDRGVRALTIFASGLLPDDRDPPLNERIRARCQEAGVELCGSNGMGFYNYAEGVAVCGFRGSQTILKGGVALITHSGSVVSALADCEERIGFNLVISAGNELVTGLADYMDYALSRSDTRAIALFMESARKPQDFARALEKAAARGIPVVALKVGRNARSAELAFSHSGAIAGSDGVYQALFERYGVIRVDSLDEMATTLQLVSQPRKAAPGGLASLHDSGGERGLYVDLAERAGVPYAVVSEETEARLAALLDPGLLPTNPLDAWGTGRDFQTIFTESMVALAEDPAVGLVYFCFDREGAGILDPAYVAAFEAAADRSEKPFAIVTPRHGTGHDPGDRRLAARGFPVLDGDWWSMKAAAQFFAWRDFQARGPMTPPQGPEESLVSQWRQRLSQGALSEDDALSMVAALGLPAAVRRTAESWQEVEAAAEALGYPLVLKTAAPGIAHKTEADGVRLGIGTLAALRTAYEDLSSRLGPAVLLAKEAPPGEELAVGALWEEGFGSLVVLASGGIAVESEGDAVFLLAPFDAQTALRGLARLRVHGRLAGLRGRAAADLDALSDALARFSAGVAALGPDLKELDVNPLRVGAEGFLALDALARGGEAAS
jgi:acyl-CoA synthetase (NDP forming)